MSKLASEEENIAIGRRLAALRASVNLPQVEFAERLRLSPRAYQNYERGEREIPASVIKSIYEAFGIDPLWVLIGPGPVPVKARRTDDADLLEQITIAVDRRLTRTRRRLEPAKKDRLIKLVYLQSRGKATFDAEQLNEMIALAG